MISSRLSPPASRLDKAKQGFALLITITLLAFLVILLIGLATFTRVETAIAGNTQRQAQARENALFALNVALGQLQKYAGPDQCVTATAEAFPNGTGTSHYTGVWDKTTTDVTPVTWLVSGNELVAADGTAKPLAIKPDSTLNTTNGVPLVSTNTSRITNDVLARLMPITATGVPGTAATASTTIGRYAWWVGDQGVKAPVAVADSSNSVTYAPYDSADLRSRIRQQIALGTGAADSGGNPVFEPRDTNNSAKDASGKTLVEKATVISQVAFLKNASNAQLGLTRVQQNFHNWSPNNYAVIANTKTGGLKQDLSLNPSLLGSAFAAWADYASYMEDSTSPATPSPSPAYGTDPLRRRYRITPKTSDQGVTHAVAPVLSFFGISFSVRESGSAAPQMEVAARCVIGLWNPYSAALVPEPLKVEVTQLPTILVEDNAGGASQLSLQSVMNSGNGPMVFALPVPVDGVDPDINSWLPGRVYDWAAPANTTETSGANPLIAHHPDATPPGAGEGIVRQTGISHGVGPTVPVGSAMTRHCHTFTATTLHLRILRASDDTELAVYDSIPFQPFGNGTGTTPMKIGDKYVDFAFVFRLPETDELPTGATDKWLSAAGRDPRIPIFPSGGFIAGPKGDDPASYGGDGFQGFAVRSSDRLLDRAGNSFSYDEDCPVFELPRAPLMSLGQLQHLQLDGQRPFCVGNSWGATIPLGGVNAGQIFDQFFFTGLSASMTPITVNNSLLLPNPQMKVLRDPATGAAPAVTDVQNAPNAQSSKFLLQGGAFNINSTNPTAWAAVLRSVRFPAPQSFPYLDADFTTGSADDTVTATVQSSDAQFLRFSQSAQETYKADVGFAASTVAPPGPPDVVSAANTHLFRQGMRTLAATEVTQLATAISGAIKARLAASGPFRSLEEFLAPGDSGAPSLLEQAIADAGINSSITEFSSQWLTQADIMTALAPVLFPRSDTFVIRAYGEVLNPATSTPAAPVIEGRAWCEAVVQRLPEYFDPSADPAEVAPASLTSPLNQTYGRRFKIVSFRWLTRSDI